MNFNDRYPQMSWENRLSAHIHGYTWLRKAVWIIIGLALVSAMVIVGAALGDKPVSSMSCDEVLAERSNIIDRNMEYDPVSGYEVAKFADDWQSGDYDRLGDLNGRVAKIQNEGQTCSL